MTFLNRKVQFAAFVILVLFSQLAWSVKAAGESIVISPQNVTNKAIKVTSPREVFLINAQNTALQALTVTINPITTFSVADLADLTNNASSGVGVYTEGGTYQSLNAAPVWSGNTVNLSFNPPLAPGNYVVTLKFKPSVANGASFSAAINDGAIASDPVAPYQATSTAPYTLDNASPTAPSDVRAWESAAKTVQLNPFEYYSFGQPYFEWSGANDSASINGYFVYFGPDQNGDPLTAGIRINHSAITSFSGGPLPTDTAEDEYLRLVTIDTSGITSAPSTVYVYRYDKKKPVKAPGAPVAQTPATDTTPTWNWGAAFDPDAGINKYQFFWVKENSGMDPFFADVTTDPLVPTFTNTTPLDGGKWVAGVRAFDAAGNFADSDLGSIAIDAPVVIPTLAPAPQSGDSGSSNATGDNSSPSTTSGNSAPAAVVASGKVGDFNGDGKVDLKDFNLFVFNWKKSNVPQDLNKDGIVDLKDFNTFAFNWNK